MDMGWKKRRASGSQARLLILVTRRLFQLIRAGAPELQFPFPDVNGAHDSRGTLLPISNIGLRRAVPLVRLFA